MNSTMITANETIEKDPDDNEDQTSEKSDTYHLLVAVVSLIAAMLICFGNTMTLLAICHNSRLQTAPNLCIGSLAVADLLVGLMLLAQGAGGLQGQDNFVENHQFVCLSLMSLLFISVAASMLSTVLVAVERFVYIVFSIHYPVLVTRTTSGVFLASLWILAFAYGSIPMYTSRYQPKEGCTPTHIFSKVYMIIVHPVLFFTVSGVTLGLYVQVGRVALKQRRQIMAQKEITTCRSGPMPRLSRSSWKMVKLLMAVFGFFFIGWCPLLVTSILEYTAHVSHTVLTICALIAVMNSGVNFIVLCFMNSDFRKEFKHILCWRCSDRDSAPLPLTTISGSLPE